MADARDISIFERHPRVTMAIFLLVVLLVFLLLAEVILKQRAGLGDPVLFVESATCGYLLRPHQDKIRFGGAHFRVNNLGLRADRDWDEDTSNRVLFLGDSVTYGGNHLSNEELFSEVAVRNLPGLESGNGGIPGWGVESVCALIVQEQFLPASIYVTTFIKDDFYRRLPTGKDKPYIWFESPRYALREAFILLWAKAEVSLGLRRRQYGDVNRRREASRAAAERAVTKLKEADELLESMGYRHLIYISPQRQQVLGEAAADSLVERLLRQNDVEADYIIDRLGLDRVGLKDRASWFQDDVHLTPKGHAVWGRLIEADLLDMIEEMGVSR